MKRILHTGRGDFWRWSGLAVLSERLIPWALIGTCITNLACLSPGPEVKPRNLEWYSTNAGSSPARAHVGRWKASSTRSLNLAVVLQKFEILDPIDEPGSITLQVGLCLSPLSRHISRGPNIGSDICDNGHCALRREGRYSRGGHAEMSIR